MKFLAFSYVNFLGIRHPIHKLPPYEWNIYTLPQNDRFVNINRRKNTKSRNISENSFGKILGNLMEKRDNALTK